MTQVTITLNSQTNLLGVFLHHPGNGHPEPLPGVAHSVQRDLPNGTYYVAASGTGITSGTAVTIKFATETNSKTRGGRVKPNGTIGLFKPFNLLNGAVS